jgi:PAS domain S-box-containing protein
MRRRGVRRLVVVDGQGQMLGLLSLTGVIKSLGGGCLESMEAAVRRLAPSDGDQTERRARKRYLEHILHTAIDMGIVATDAEFHITYANEAARAILGPSLDGAVGQDARLFHARGRIKTAAFYKCLAAVRATGSHSFKMQLGGGDKGRVVSARVVALKDDGALVGYVLTLRDITVRMARGDHRRMAFTTCHRPAQTYLLMERQERELAPRGGWARAWPSWPWTWTASSRSTTSGGTRPGTGSCARYPSACAAPCARATPWPAWAATSSPSWPRRRATRPRPSGSRRRFWPPWTRPSWSMTTP